MQQYDKSSKWLIQHHGDSVLWLAGVRDIESWQPLAVARILASLRYNEPGLLNILGGREGMIEFPAIREVVAEKCHNLLLRVLRGRFKSVPPEVDARIRAIEDDDLLLELGDRAGECPDIDSFLDELNRLVR